MAGASGYILKEATGQDLIGAVHHVAAGHSLIDPLMTERVLDRVRNGPETAPELANLTEQELKLLELVAEGLTNRQIGERMFLAEKTVKNYVSTMLQKLGLERRTQAAVLASRLLSDHPRTEGGCRALPNDQRHAPHPGARRRAGSAGARGPQPRAWARAALPRPLRVSTAEIPSPSSSTVSVNRPSSTAAVIWTCVAWACRTTLDRASRTTLSSDSRICSVTAVSTGPLSLSSGVNPSTPRVLTDQCSELPAY